MKQVYCGGQAASAARTLYGVTMSLLRTTVKVTSIPWLKKTQTTTVIDGSGKIGSWAAVNR